MSSLILLVDDDQLLREVIGEFLAARGYQVDMAENSCQALRLLEPGKYRLALIDQGVSNPGGMKLLKEIRKQDPGVFCLLMTGYSRLNSVYQYLEEGHTDYIIKPFQLKELLNIMNKHL